MQLDEQVAAPPQLSEQPTVQPVILQVAVPVHERLQLFPGQSRTTDVALVPVAPHPPPGQEKLQDPPVQVNEQDPPVPPQVSSQSLEQVQATPATHSSPPQETKTRLAANREHNTSTVRISLSPSSMG